MIDLTPFYDADDIRGEITRPFSDAQYTYATDSHVVIRVPRRPEIEESKFAPRADKLFAEHTTEATRQWFDIPELPEPIMEKCFCTFELSPDPCEDCRGAGVVEKIKSVDINGVPFQRKYLALIKALPGCTISPSGQYPAWFKFNGGDGLLMPMRERR